MIRLANPNDAMRISEIIIYGWRIAYADIINDKFLYKNMSVVKRYNTIVEILKSEHNYYVYEDDEIVKAVFLIGESREEEDNKYDEINTTLELIAFYVEPVYKNLGIGSMIIKECEKIAKSKNKKEIKLWVLEENKIARKFYEKHGFKSSNSSKRLEQLGVNEIRYIKKLRC